MIRFVLVYFIFCWLFFAFFASGFVDSQDGFQYLTIARRVYYDHTFAMPEVLWPDNLHMSINKGRDGKFYSVGGLGYTLALLPAVAIEDVFLKLAHQSPATVFPLQNDWPVLLAASMTNAFYGALLVVVLYLYLRSFAFTHWQSVLFSFGLTLSSGLWVYTKHVFPHMMFVSFLTATFYLIRRHALTLNRWWLVAAAASFGIVVLSYNPSYLLTVPALGLYFLLLHKPRINKKWVRARVIDIGVGLVSGLPFLIAYVLFNRLRFGGTGTSGYDSSGNLSLPLLPSSLIPVVEGIWGVLFSPGKSVFLFAPILLVLIIFAYKLPKKVVPEIVAFVTMAITYVWFIGTLEGDVGFLVWHGESSWGPRYMLPLFPLAIILVAHIVMRMKRWQKIVFFAPAVAIGLCIQIIGISLPYQVRFYGLPQKAIIGERIVDISEFGNLIPRYSPVFTMGKLAVHRLKSVRMFYDHGLYDVRLFDGFAQPFDVGFSVWRESLDDAFISFNNNPARPVTKIALQFKNHQIDPTSSVSAHLTYILNGTKLAQETDLKIGEEKETVFDLSSSALSEKRNILEIQKTFVGTDSASLKNKQVLFLEILRINDLPQPIGTIDYPYVSPISTALFDKQSYYFGKSSMDPWAIWHMHSLVYERTFDFWWLRPLSYWDLPKRFFLTLLILDVAGIGYFGWLVVKFNPQTKSDG